MNSNDDILYISICEYLKIHPGDRNIYSLDFYFGEEKAIRILKNANGRRILLYNVPNCYDLAHWKYEDEDEFHI